MTSREDIEAFLQVQKEIVAEATADLSRLLAGVDTGNVDVVRRALLDLVPALISEYGDAAAAAAADWYEAIRPEDGYTALTAGGRPLDEIEREIGDMAGHWKGVDPHDLPGGLAGAMQRHIVYSARATVARNIDHDPSKPRWARVPVGPKTCAWCEMLSSRGWVYRSEQSAGAAGNAFHPGDDCQIVPEWAAGSIHLTGYDPDAMYDRYLQARAELERAGNSAPTDRDIAWQLRHLFPDQYTDGIRVRPQLVPNDDVWIHILHGDHLGGGHSFGAGIDRKTEAPEDWTKDVFLSAALAVQQRGVRKQGTAEGIDIFEGIYRQVLFRVVIRDGEIASTYPIRGDEVAKNIAGERVPQPLRRSDPKKYHELHDSAD